MMEDAELVYVCPCMQQVACQFCLCTFSITNETARLSQVLVALRGKCMPGSHEARHSRHAGRMLIVGDILS